MRRLVIILGIVAAPALAQVTQVTELEGRWTVDLATDPKVPYTQPMELRLLPDGTITGSFYNSTIEAGRWKRDRGRLCASFRTSDGKGPYHTSVCARGGGAEGQTWAEHRGFLFNWNATRVP